MMKAERIIAQGIEKKKIAVAKFARRDFSYKQKQIPSWQ
jgi:hypothetical protein